MAVVLELKPEEKQTQEMGPRRRVAGFVSSDDSFGSPQLQQQQQRKTAMVMAMMMMMIMTMMMRKWKKLVQLSASLFERALPGERGRKYRCAENAWLETSFLSSAEGGKRREDILIA